MGSGENNLQNVQNLVAIRFSRSRMVPVAASNAKQPTELKT